MDQQWIFDHLSDRLDDTKTIVNLDDVGTCVMVDTMVLMFGSVNPVTYEALSATAQASQGWQQYFDQWKAEGILSIAQ